MMSTSTSFAEDRGIKNVWFKHSEGAIAVPLGDESFCVGNNLEATSSFVKYLCQMDGWQ